MRHVISLVLAIVAVPLYAAPPDELAYQLKASVVKVHVATKTGGHGVGTGVVVGKDLVATNCHILANANGVNITKFGDSFAPDGLKADWAHDVCILRFRYLELKPVELGDSDQLHYEQAMFSIGFPGGPPKPQTTYGKIKAIYPLDDSVIVRTDASFVMGASGSPVFDQAGKLIAISTFKSPGRNAFFYNLPVKWVKALIDAPEVTSLTSQGTPFWDAPTDLRPYFMQVVLPFQTGIWPELQRIATDWVAKEPNTSEAYYYLGVAYVNQGRDAQALQAFKRAINLQPQHTGSLIALGLLANKAGQASEVERIHTALMAIDAEASAELAAKMAHSNSKSQ